MEGRAAIRQRSIFFGLYRFLTAQPTQVSTSRSAQPEYTGAHAQLKQRRTQTYVYTPAVASRPGGGAAGTATSASAAAPGAAAAAAIPSAFPPPGAEATAAAGAAGGSSAAAAAMSLLLRLALDARPMTDCPRGCGDPLRMCARTPVRNSTYSLQPKQAQRSLQSPSLETHNSRQRTHS